MQDALERAVSVPLLEAIVAGVSGR